MEDDGDHYDHVDPQFCPSTLIFYSMGVTLTYRSYMVR